MSCAWILLIATFPRIYLFISFWHILSVMWNEKFYSWRNTLCSKVSDLIKYLAENSIFAERTILDVGQKRGRVVVRKDVIRVSRLCGLILLTLN